MRNVSLFTEEFQNMSFRKMTQKKWEREKEKKTVWTISARLTENESGNNKVMYILENGFSTKMTRTGININWLRTNETNNCGGYYIPPSSVIFLRETFKKIRKEKLRKYNTKIQYKI